MLSRLKPHSLYLVENRFVPTKISALAAGEGCYVYQKHRHYFLVLVCAASYF